MFNVGDYAVNVNFGVCKIEEIITPSPSLGEYYSLSPVDGSGVRISLPVNGCEKFLRPPVSEERANELVSGIAVKSPFKGISSKQKSELYRDLYLSMNEENWLALAIEGNVGPKKLSGGSEYLKKAEAVLLSELAFVLKTGKTQIKLKLAETYKQ